MVKRKRKSSRNEDFLNKIKGKVEEAKVAGLSFSEMAKKRGPEVTKLLRGKGREGLSKGIATARKAVYSRKETLELIERLGSLKAAGLITEGEFQQKKKELLARF